MSVSGNGSVLIVDDEPSALKVLSAILKEAGYHVFEARSVEQAIELIHNNYLDAIITDLKMPNKDGMQLFDFAAEQNPDIPVIFLTAYGTVESAVNAMTNGAFYYFIKPPDYLKLKSILARAIEQHRLKKEVEDLREWVFKEKTSYNIIGNTPQITDILKTIKAVKDSESNILIYGKTGTGKELIARKLHYSSKRYDKPFIAVNCAAIPRELLESELFGYEKGAFTGAVSRRLGKFEEAGNGTVFLDEIGELALPLQSKLLRVLQEREIERLGDNKKRKVNFRLIASTNRHLETEIQESNFRQDLYYRVNVVQIEVPPLRSRKDDIPLLATDFLKEFCLRENKMLTLSDETMEILLDYSWPGNVRQLKNVIERAVVLARGKKIKVCDLPRELSEQHQKTRAVPSVKSLKEIEFQAIKDALHGCNGNKSKAARQLGISRKAFYKRLREIQLH